MSVPASEMGSVSSGSTSVPAADTPSTQTSSEAVQTAASQGSTSWLGLLTSPFQTIESKIGSALADSGLILVGVVLAVGALLIGLNKSGATNQALDVAARIPVE
jgi:hypothetical protein